MFRQSNTTLIICLTCAATVAAHAWIVRSADRRLEPGAFEIGEHAPLIGMDPPLPDEIILGLPETLDGNDSHLRSLTTAALDDGSLHQPTDAHRVANDEVVETNPPEQPPSRRQQAEQATVRTVIDDEMPEASEEERDIWFEELKSLPSEVVRDLLQVRKQLRVLSPDHALSGPSQLRPQTLPLAPLMPRDLPVDPIKQTRVVPLGEWSESRAALEEAIAWSTHNVANAATPGFKRTKVLSGDAYRLDRLDETSGSESPFLGFGCRLAVVQLDMTPGELQESQRPLDLAIDGDGLFVLRADAAEQDIYTRAGRLSLDDQRRLCVLHDEEPCLLQPVITVPAQALSVIVSAEGAVSVQLADSAEPQVIGQLQLAVFVDLSRLAPLGNGLFLAPPTVLPCVVKPGSSPAGVIRQGYLELSNVDVAREQADREMWESILRSLPTNEIPRTARETTRSPN